MSTPFSSGYLGNFVYPAMHWSIRGYTKKDVSPFYLVSIRGGKNPTHRVNVDSQIIEHNSEKQHSCVYPRKGRLE